MLNLSMKMKGSHSGDHKMNSITNLLFTLKGCSSEKIDNKRQIFELLEDLTKLFNSKVVHRAHKYYTSHGITVCFFLSTSHIIYSSWPEYDLVLLEISTCTKCPGLNKVKHLLTQAIGCQKIFIKSMELKLK